MNKIELAWAAGYFEGDGTITLTGGQRRGRNTGFYVGVSESIRTPDEGLIPEPIRRFAAALPGVGVVRGPYHDRGRRAIYKWYALGVAGEEALARLWPYLSADKRDQATRVRARRDS